MEVFELHYLEQPCPHLVTSWEHSGRVKEDGILSVVDLRAGYLNLSFYNEKKYWNIDQREHFLHNTSNYWRGLRNKHVDSGMIIDNDPAIESSDVDHCRKTKEEIKASIEKFGPLMAHDYSYHYRYQFYKNIYDEKKKLINQSFAL